MKYDIELTRSGDWITGVTFDDETEEYSSKWSKLVDEAWDRKFAWIVDTPKKHIWDNHGVEIDLNTSNDIENLFEGFHPELNILLSHFKVIFGSNVDYVNETIKLFLGPIAAFSKEKKIYGRNLAHIIPIHDWLFLLSDTELKFNQKKNILTEMLTQGGEYEDVRPKHVFDGISDDVIESFLIEVVKNNDAQWNKAKTSPALYNWFVGQAMKEYKGKVDAAKVMEIVQKLKGRM